MQRVLSALAALLLPITALADGKVFPTAFAANVTIPDQRALIHFTNGIERLVIETRFTGSGTNFAWVIPLPAPPVIEEASSGLFPTLQYIFRPEVVHDVPRYYLGILAAIWIGYLLLFVRANERIKMLDLVACAGVAVCASQSIEQFSPTARMVALGGVFLVLLLGVADVRLRRESVRAVAGLVLFIFLVPTLLLPSLATSRAGASSSSAADAVAVLDRQIVGVFETQTIASHDPEALRNWLRGHGFLVPTNSESVIASYVKDGWVFVTAKIRRDDERWTTNTPHPLSLTFKTERPVYPMRLTGVDNGPVQVNLYVFGPKRAAARHFKVERCTHPTYPVAALEDWSSFATWASETPGILHPLLRQWVDGSPVATKLTATLAPADMRQDVWLDWVSFSEKRSRLFSRQGALLFALNWGTGVLGIGLLAACILAAGIETRRLLLPRLATGITMFGLVLCGAIYVGATKTEVRLIKWPGARRKNNLFQISVELEYGGWSTPQQARAEARALIARPLEPGWKTSLDWQNQYLGGPIREEDSPGNYLLREQDGHLKFIIYDAKGAACVLDDWSVPRLR